MCSDILEWDLGDLERTDMLEILSSMGVHISDDAKISGKLLDRLTDALNAAQNRDKLPKTLPLDSDMAQKWPVRLRPPERESVKWAVWRGSEEERNVMLWRPYSAKWWDDPFWGLRQTMTILAHTIDIGCHWVTIRDPSLRMRRVITIRLLHTLEIDVGTPGIVLAYEAWDPFDVPFPLVFKSLPIGQKIMNISASPLEMKLILHLLAINTKLLPYSYCATVDVFQCQSVSILLPIGPLSFRDVDRLGNNRECERCGNKRWGLCSHCHSVSYCSAFCQRTDWLAHKRTCLSLQGGKWCTVPFRVYPPGEGGLAPACSYYLNMNFRRPWTASNSTWPEEDDLPPPNIHGTRTFLVKLQAPLIVWAHPALLIYDEQHSFDEVFFYAEDSPSIYAAFVQKIQGPRGGSGGNMYRWARRTGDRELTVCFDREPVREIGKW